MKKSYPIWAILGLGMLALGVVMAGANVAAYISLPALIVVVLPPFFLVVGGFGLSVLGRSFHVAFLGVPTTPQELEMGVSLFGALQRYLLLTGLITTMIGFIAMLSNLYETNQIGPMIALALITLFYSMMLILAVTVPFKSALEKRLIERVGANGE